MTKTIESTFIYKGYICIIYKLDDGECSTLEIDVGKSTITDKNITAWTFTCGEDGEENGCS